MRVLFLAAVVPGLLSCSSPGTPPPARRTPATHTVTIEAVAYAPQTLTVELGDSIVWVNKDPFPHSVTDARDGFDSSSLQPDQRWTLTPTKTGELTYVCTLHPTMKGTIVVR